MVNTEKQFTIGQKVRLNSGSPELTVTEISDRVRVEWADGSNKEISTFPSTSLTAL
jgi:uncharacterized protein YodC (DUF2158 family)